MHQLGQLQSQVALVGYIFVGGLLLQEIRGYMAMVSPMELNLSQFDNPSESLIMPGRVFPMSINQNVTVYRNQAPRPS